MKLVVISPEAGDAREPAVLRDLFAAGLERYHVRKPGWSREQLTTWLCAAPEEFRARLVLHQHHDLGAEFGCGGVHWPEAEAASARPTSLFTSRSSHDLAGVRTALGRFDSIFVSPIFASLSKPGYAPRASFPCSALAALLATRTEAERRTRVLALGGVTVERLPQVRALGFDGAAVLGAIWQAADPVAAFVEFQSALSLSCHAA